MLSLKIKLLSEALYTKCPARGLTSTLTGISSDALALIDAEEGVKPPHSQ